MESSSAAQIAALETPVERRFYPRFVPSAPIRIDPGKLFNIGENGLLIRTPTSLKLDSVLRISLGAETLPSVIHVCGRVVWTDQLSMRAGIQLLDLSDQGREQIRGWGVLGSSRPNVERPPVAAKAFVQPFTPTPRARSSKEEHEAAGVRRSATAALLAILLGLVLGTLCAGAVIFFRDAHSLRKSAGSTGSSGVPVSRVVTPHDLAGPPEIRDSFSDSGSGNEITEINASTALPSVQTIPPHGQEPQAPNADPGNPALKVAHIDSDRAMRNQSETTETDAEQQGRTSALPHPFAENKAVDDKNHESLDAGTSVANLQAVAQQERPPRLLSVDKVVPLPPSPNDAQETSSSTVSGPTSSTDAGPISSVKASVTAVSPALRIMDKEISSAGETDGAKIIQMVPPQRSVLEILAPAGSHSSVLALPNERVLQSTYITTRIRRTILLAPTRNWFFNRKKKVVVGELISRVEPQRPRDRIYSDVFVRVKATVAPDGHVERVQSLGGPATLFSSVFGAVREWRYQPTLVNDSPVETESYIEIQFHAQAQAARQ